MANTRSRTQGTQVRRKTGSRRRPSTTTEQILDKAGIDLRVLNGRGGFKKTMRKTSQSPLAAYLAGSVGAFFLARFLYRYYQDHPEILTTIRDNFDSIEDRLREFRSNLSSEIEDARH